MASFAAPISLRATSLSRRLKAVVRAFFWFADLVIAAILVLVVLFPILIGMQIMRMKQWADDYNEEL